MACIGGDPISRIIENAILLENNPEPERKGGYLAIYDCPTERLICTPFGEITEIKKARYCRNATEKVTRLIENGESRSFSSRNEVKQHWGGGVRYNAMIIAFSGFVELIDEAVSLVYAVYKASEMYSKEKPSSFEFKSEIIRDTSSIAEKNYKDNPFIFPLVLATFK